MGMLLRHHREKGEVKKASPTPEKEVVKETPKEEFVAKKRKRDN